MDLTVDAPPRPTLEPAAFDRVGAALAASGPDAAVAALVAELEAAGDFANLFYALLLRKRVELGVSPFPTGPASELPPETHEPYESAIRDAGRRVGRMCLDRGDLAQAWTFYRMLGEPEPVREALERLAPGPDDDVYPLIEIAWQNGLLPKKGFDLVLDRHGVCSAITMASGSDLNANPDLRDYCVGRLLRALHDQLTERLRADLKGRGTAVPADASLARMVAGHPELFGEDGYHVDVSHLSSVVQMCLHLRPGRELDLARDLCEYGRHLAPGLRGGGEAPFEESYDDYHAYLNVLAGAEVEEGIARFRGKAEREAEQGSTYASQVYVNLLVRVGRTAEALAAARQLLLAEDERNLICPGVTDLARRVGDYAAVAEAGRARSDGVQFLAGLLAGRQASRARPVA